MWYRHRAFDAEQYLAYRDFASFSAAACDCVAGTSLTEWQSFAHPPARASAATVRILADAMAA